MLFHKHKRALLHGVNTFIEPGNPMIMNVEGDPPEAPADPAPPATPAAPAAQTFSQDDVNRMVANERRSTAEKLATLQASADKVAGLEASVQEMTQAKELADASTAEQATILAQRAADQHQAKLDEHQQTIASLQADKTTAATELAMFKTRTALSSALAAAGMLGAASKHAVPAMLSEAEVTLTEAGDIATIKLNGIMQADVPSAVATFLTENPHFKAAAPGGGGTSMPTPGAGMVADKPLHEQSDNALWVAANLKQ